MKTPKIILGMIAMISVASALWAGNAFANTYYVRDGGGNAAQCTGTTNAVYNGSGVNQPCAFNHPRYAIGWDSDNPQPGKMSGGDTLYINGDSDINPGAQAQYEIGYDDTGKNLTPSCSPSWPYDCTLANLPAGTSTTARTSIIGTGSHKPQLWGTQRVWEVLSADNNHILLQNLEITDHSACAYNDPSSGCNYSGPYPYGQWAEDGVYVGGDDVNMTDVYVHGVARYGMYTDNFGSANFTRVYSIGNGYGGVSTGVNATISGTLTWNQPIIEWNGCVEAYPVANGMDNPSNYSQCFGQNSGGYGDGMAFGNVGHGGAGNWTITGPGSISFNTQDGLDTLHGNGTGTIQIDKMRFEGNAGNQVKMNAVNAYLTNSVVIGDCGWWLGSPQAYSGFQGGDICRALGDAVLINVTNSSVAQVYNNTIVSNGNIALETEDLNGTGCNSSTSISAKNNIVLGGYAWIDDRTFNSSGGNAQTTFTYNDGSDGNGAGTCGALVWNEDYNIVSGTKNNNQGCSGAHDKCGTVPGFASSIPMGAAGGAESTYYQGNAAETLVSLSSSSPAITSGVAGLSYWNNENDYNNVARTSPPSVGGLEKSSCAVNGYGCFYNSDCCAGSCSNFTCGTANTRPQPVVAITSPVSGSSLSAGSNLTVTATASETNGTITNISLYNGAVLLGSGTASPYSFVMTNLAAGTYTLTAQATDANGTSVTSNAVTVTITAQSLLPSLPVVNITSPVSGSSFTAGSNIAITTTASETNGTIKTIALYNGAGVLLGSSSTSPFNFTYSDVLAATYTFTAQVTDANGVSVTSSPVTVTVTAPPTPVVALTSPSNGASVTTGSNVTITASASETNGSIASVSFYYNGSNLLGTITTAPYSVTITNVPAGSYTLTAVAMDANGVSTTSTPVTATVATAVIPSAPVVSLTSPVSGSSFTAGNNIAMTATASETNGTISKVAFYNGSTLLGTSTSSPYSFTWSNVAAGSYTLTAVATDATNVTVTSSSVAVTVKAVPSLPVVSMTSPTNASSFTAGNNIVMTATASETNGTISKVAFYNGSTLLGTSTSSPYSFTWSNVAAGSYTLTAVATDATNVTVTSSSVAVTVKAVPSLPVVSMTSPTNASSFTAGNNITMTASASETNGTISKVAFYNGSTLLGTSTSSPYGFTWNNVGVGSYSLTAVATDANGVTVTSSIVSITVNAAPSLPVIALTSPTSASSFTAGNSITMTATASETNGTISKVAFYNGSTLLGTSTSSPYGFTWNNVGVGSYSLTAVATDANGVTVTSSIVSITVNAAPSLPVIALTSPTSASSFTAGNSITMTATASETNGTISKVAFYNGSTLLGTDTSSPYSFTWNNVGAGNYSLTAVATDANGVTVTSSIVSITVNAAPSLPVIALTSPTSASSFTAGNSITMTATASETNGTISKVAFYNGSTLLGTDTSSPYSFTWNNVGAGNYSLTAVATDANGVTVTSSIVSITVNAVPSLPVVALTSPTNGSSATAGSNVTLTASASETNGSIAQVSFYYNGTNLLGVSTKAPYSVTVTNVPAGSYSLTAVATDANGVTVSSKSVAVSVVTKIVRWLF